ncbi:hypothetical protein ULF88_08225 [Halopseudomonas pachastrellae]|nr:hypothetical protein [Halopseudomonas pachastrellae]
MADARARHHQPEHQQRRAADVELHAPASLLARLLVSSDRKAVLQDPDVELLGDSQVLIALQNALADLQLDGEAELARWLGPVAGHAIGSALRRSHQWGRDSRASLRQTLAEYLTEESRQLVGQAEARARAEQLHDLRLQLDRLEARVALLSPTIRTRRRMRLTAFVRLLRILHIFTRYRLDQILLDLPLPLLGRLLLQLGPWRLRPAPKT